MSDTHSHGHARIWPNRIWPELVFQSVDRIWPNRIWPELVFLVFWPNFQVLLLSLLVLVLLLLVGAACCQDTSGQGRGLFND